MRVSWVTYNTPRMFIILKFLKHTLINVTPHHKKTVGITQESDCYSLNMTYFEMNTYPCPGWSHHIKPHYYDQDDMTNTGCDLETKSMTTMCNPQRRNIHTHDHKQIKVHINTERIFLKNNYRWQHTLFS